MHLRLGPPLHPNFHNLLLYQPFLPSPYFLLSLLYLFFRSQGHLFAYISLFTHFPYKLPSSASLARHRSLNLLRYRSSFPSPSNVASLQSFIPTLSALPFSRPYIDNYLYISIFLLSQSPVICLPIYTHPSFHLHHNQPLKFLSPGKSDRVFLCIGALHPALQMLAGGRLSTCSCSLGALRNFRE